MRQVSAVVILGLLVGAWGQGIPNIVRPPCDSPEAEEAALVAQDYINSQLTHGYKYALNQVEDIKIIQKPDGAELYVMDLELLETKCHILDPTPLANCTVRPRHETKVEADCDVVLSKSAAALSVMSYKCKSEPDSAEDLCLGCPILQPLNHTDALQVVTTSLDAFNSRADNESALFALREVGRLSSQIVSGGPQFLTEYAIVETNCTVTDIGPCVPSADPLARTGFCTANGIPADVTVDCTVFDAAVAPLYPLVNGTEPVVPPVVPKFQTTPGLKHHHRLSAVHDPAVSGLLSESKESQEVPIVKRQVPAEVPAVTAVPEVGTAPAVPLLPLIPICPGKKRHF